MRFNGICILTPDVERLGAFYSELLHARSEREGDNITFFTEGAQLAIYSHAGMEQMSPGSMTGAGVGCVTFDFEVEDIDYEHARMTARGVPCIKPPVTYPWGRRSAWFRDPDGNIINLFSRVSS